jgi:membrane-associated phospholipid phosphatase
VGRSSEPRPGWLEDAERLDRAIYVAVARTETPSLDRMMQRLSQAADRSRLNIAAAALLAAAGGRAGRRAAKLGIASVAVSSAVVNAAIKPVARRRRPDREMHSRVPEARHVAMPTSRSLPSGHSASAFAFATGVGQVMPHGAAPLRVLAALVAYSRVHTGVHYPGDVVIGALLGTTIAQATAYAVDRS